LPDAVVLARVFTLSYQNMPQRASQRLVMRDYPQLI